MRKIALLFTIIVLLTNCSDPYDGETKYIFETTVVDSDNNPISNLNCNAVFYNVDSNGNEINFLLVENRDLIVSSVSDANGKVRLIFPFSKQKERLKIEIGKDVSSFPGTLFQFINLQEGDFSNFKRTEPSLMLFNPSELVGLEIEVLNSSSNKYVSKIEFNGKKQETVKNFQPILNELGPIQITESFYDVAKNQVATLKYEVTTLNSNGQETIVVIEEQITIQSENITYEITL